MARAESLETDPARENAAHATVSIYQFNSLAKRPLFDRDRDQEWRGVAGEDRKSRFDLHSQGIAFSLYGVLD